MGRGDGAVRLQSDGTAWRPLIHVQDMARSYLRRSRRLASSSTARRSTRARPSELPGSRPRAARRGGRSWRDVEFADGAGADPRSYRVDFSKIAEELEFRPEWDARCGAQQLADTYRAAGLDEAMFSSDRFVRLARLKTLMSAGRLDDQLRWRHPPWTATD